jgi:hypothetical protein
MVDGKAGLAVYNGSLSDVQDVRAMEGGAGVFVSYAHEDRDAARRVAAYVGSLGFNVWWDRQLAIGADIHESVLRQVGEADAVIVLWSQYSIKSHWVRGEAQAALDEGKLIPILIEHCEPPLNFRSILTLEAFEWRRRGFADQRLEDAIRSASKLEKPRSGSAQDQSEGFGGNGKTAEYVAAGVLALVAVLLAIVLSDWQAQTRFSPNYVAGVVAPLTGVLLLAVESAISHMLPILAATGLRRVIFRKAIYYIVPIVAMRASFAYFEQHLPAVATDESGAAVLANFMVSAAIGVVSFPVLWSIPALIVAYFAARGAH